MTAASVVIEAIEMTAVIGMIGVIEETAEINTETETASIVTRRATTQRARTKIITTTAIEIIMDETAITKENVILTETKIETETTIKTEEMTTMPMNRNLLRENERLDDLGRNGYYIIQDPK